MLTSELATNAGRYSRGPASVRLNWRPSILRVAVWDANPRLPARSDAGGKDADGGRGLLILDVFADRWGGYALGEEPFGLAGKLVWFEIGTG